MPANKNALTRIVLLDKLLADRYHAYSIQDMKEYLDDELPQFGQEKGITKRCVEKDIEYLEYNFPIFIEFERYSVDAHSANTDRVYKKRCIRYADPTFSIFNAKLTEEEKGLLSTALTTIGSFDGLNSFGWLDNLSKRLGLEERRPAIQTSKNLLENKTLMAELFAAVNSCAVVRINYRLFNSSDTREVIISPYLLKEYNGRWYIIGAADDTGRILNFALDRIDSVETMPGYEFRPIPTDLFDRYDDIVGITYYEDSEVLRIYFWASTSASPYIETKPVHGSQRILTGENDRRIRSKFNVPSDGNVFSIDCMENYELIRELCAYGAELKVLSPQSIVDKIKARIKSMDKIYGF